MKHIRTPNDYKDHGCAISLFLAGSIALNTANDWQDELIKLLEPSSVAILNPRSQHWVEPETADEFGDLVTWDWDAMMFADFVVVYFDGNTKSPIALLELGMLAIAKPNKVVVVCPDDFWRSKHVTVLCDRYDIHQTDGMCGVLEWLQQPYDIDG